MPQDNFALEIRATHVLKRIIFDRNTDRGFSVVVATWWGPTTGLSPFCHPLRETDLNSAPRESAPIPYLPKRESHWYVSLENSLRIRVLRTRSFRGSKTGFSRVVKYQLLVLFSELEKLVFYIMKQSKGGRAQKNRS